MLFSEQFHPLFIHYAAQCVRRFVFLPSCSRVDVLNRTVYSGLTVPFTDTIAFSFISVTAQT